MATQTLNAHVRETGKSGYAVEIAVGAYVLKCDEPGVGGEEGLGPTPHQMLLASLGGCTAMTVRWYAHRHEFPLECVSVDLTYRKGVVEGHTDMADIFTKTISLIGAGLTQEQRAKLIDVAGKCPIQRLLEGTPFIVTTKSE